MFKPNFIFKAVGAFILCFLTLASNAAAQPDAQVKNSQPSYEAVLQIVLGSNDAAQKSNLPAALNSVAKNLKSNFTFSNYSLSDTYIGRVADTGTIEYKTISGNFGQSQNSQTPVFLDWTIGNLRSAANEKGQNTVDIQPFRFGARVPITSGSSVINYESIGLNLMRVNVPENAPTLVGTMPNMKNGETIFLVLTVKKIEE